MGLWSISRIYYIQMSVTYDLRRETFLAMSEEEAGFGGFVRCRYRSQLILSFDLYTKIGGRCNLSLLSSTQASSAVSCLQVPWL